MNVNVNKGASDDKMPKWKNEEEVQAHLNKTRP